MTRAPRPRLALPARCAAVFLAAGVVATAARAGDWADERSAAGTPAYAASRAICAALKGVAVPPGDGPSAAEAADLADCSSEALYFGIGRPADPKAARRCAFVEKKVADRQVENFGYTGDRMLMMVYANGRGAERNLDLAAALACRAGGAPAEIDARVRRLARLKGEGGGASGFDLCEDAASGFMKGVCADHGQLVARAARAKARAALVKDWTADQRAALLPLERAARAYGDAHGQDETDQSGSGRAALVVDAEEKQDGDFEGLLAALATGRLAPATPAEATAAEAALDRSYRALLAGAPTAFAGTTVTAAKVARTQRLWLKYRNAWLAFATRAFPAVPADALSSRLARDRARQFADIPAGGR